MKLATVALRTLVTVLKPGNHTGILGDIFSTLCSEKNLTPELDGTLANMSIDHIDQNNESDANFITRLGAEYDALISITRSDGDKHSYAENQRNKYTVSR